MMKFIGWIHKGSDFTLHSSPGPIVVDGIRALFRGFLADPKELTTGLEPSRLLNSCLADPQLLAVAYRRWGRGFQSRLFGEYAYALLDECQRELLLGHDTLGLLPLFYADTPRLFAFSSHLEELVALTGIGSIDEEYIADCFALTTHFGERTPYRHIRRLMPGQGLLVRDGARPQAFQTYDPAGVETLHMRNRSAYLEQCRWLVGKAVASAIPSTGRVWSELSGGLDSSTVVSVAARLPRTAIEALSIVFGHSQTADETDWIQTILKKHPIPWHTLDAHLAPPFSKFPDSFCGEPNRSLILTGFHQRYDDLLREHGVRVVLTGHGGDAVFIGDAPEPYFLADMMPMRPGALVAAVREWACAVPEQRPFAYWLRRYGIAPMIRRRLGRRVTTVLFELPAWLRRDYVYAMQLEHRRYRRRPPRGLSIGNEYFWERIRTTSHLVSIDLYQRSEHCEYRSPLLYLPLVEFMLAVPWTQKLMPNEDRCLQRDALRGILPEKTRRRRGKSGSDQAVFDGLKRNPDWVDFLTTRCHLVERGYLDANQWRLAVMRARYGQSACFPYFLTACILETWFKQLSDAPKPSQPMARGLDHIVHAARDLNAEASYDKNRLLRRNEVKRGFP